MCCNATVSNLDNHPRSHALLAEDRDYRLDPAYDTTPTPVVAIERYDLAMTCVTAGRPADTMILLAPLAGSCWTATKRKPFSTMSPGRSTPRVVQ